MSMLDTIIERMGSLLIKSGSLLSRDAPPMAQGVNWFGATGMPAHPKAAEGLKVYQRNPWAYAATNSIINAISTTPLFLRKKVLTKDGLNYEMVHEHQALELLSRPMPKGQSLQGRTHLTQTLLKQITWIHLLASGEAFWAVGGRMGAFSGFDGVPTEMHPLIPENVDIRMGANNYIDSYVYRVGGRQFTLLPKDVVHFKLPDPMNPYRGQSAYLSAGIPIDTELESDKYLWHWFKNRAMPDTVVVSEKEPRADEQDRVREAWSKRYQGSENAGKVSFLWGSKEIKDLSKSQRDMQFKELKEYNRDVIMANLRVGKGMLGMMEDQSRANADAQDYIFGKRVIYPYMAMWCDQLTMDFLPLFGGSEGLEFWFDEQAVIPADEVGKSDTAVKLFNIGAISINEARSKFNLPVRNEQGADTLWMPIAKVSLEDAIGGTDFEDPGAEGEDDLEEPDFEEEEFEYENRDPPKVKNSSSLFNDQNEIEIFTKRAIPHAEASVRAGIQLMLETDASDLTVDFVFDLPAARAAVKTMALQFATNTLKTTKADLQKVIEQAIQEGRSNQELATAISRKYGSEYRGYRAMRIARTETTKAVNTGKFETLKAEGAEYKVWQATDDDRTRETHRELDNEAVRVHDKFNVGGHLADGPADGSLPPEESVNCRCTMTSGKFLDTMKSRDAIQLFLRAHGSLERSFARTVRSLFDAQKKRVLSKLS